MSLEKQVIIDLIETIQDGSVQVRTKTVIVEDGNQISESFHRHIVAPGDDYSQEDARVQAICAVVHTSPVIAEYQAKLAIQRQIQ